MKLLDSLLLYCMVLFFQLFHRIFLKIIHHTGWGIFLIVGFE